MKVIEKFGKKFVEDTNDEYMFWVEYEDDEYRCSIKLSVIEDYIIDGGSEDEIVSALQKIFPVITKKIISGRFTKVGTAKDFIKVIHIKEPDLQDVRDIDLA